MNDLIFFYTIYNKVQVNIFDSKSIEHKEQLENLKQDAIKQYQNDAMFHRSFDIMKQLILQSEEEEHCKFCNDILNENDTYCNSCEKFT